MSCMDLPKWKKNWTYRYLSIFLPNNVCDVVSNKKAFKTNDSPLLNIFYSINVLNKLFHTNSIWHFSVNFVFRYLIHRRRFVILTALQWFMTFNNESYFGTFRKKPFPKITPATKWIFRYCTTENTRRLFLN